MRLLLPLTSIALGAVVGVVVVSLLLFAELSRATVLPLPFALLGTAVIATSHGMLLERGLTRLLAYAAAPVAGGVLGAAWLGLMSGLDPANALLGGQYGVACAAAWAAIHLALVSLGKVTTR